MSDRLDLTLTLHGLEEHHHDVDGEVFARKLTAFLKGIRLSDKAVNGQRRHKLLLTELSKNTATASVREQIYNRGPTPSSGMRYFANAVEAVYYSRPETKDLDLGVVRQIANLNNGAGHSFAFAEFKTSRGTVIRIDDYLGRKARALTLQLDTAEEESVKLFTGIAFGSFDGTLEMIDIRGDMRKAVLTLTAGSRSIECVVSSLTVAQLKDALGSRVTVYGRAHYDGHSGLPVRVDVTDAKPLRPAADANLGRWQGAFCIPQPEAEDWS